MGSAEIPAEGFTLRLICGGSDRISVCSQCPWLSRCQGCVLPNSSALSLSLHSGECLAVDWHFVVYEDILDVPAAAGIASHPSVKSEAATASETKVPLSLCLDKFMEKEPLDGVVCPKCKACHTNTSSDGGSDGRGAGTSGGMQKSFTIWRQPPVLIVQIKRFQFDRTSRRKLNTCIDFLLDGLDVAQYMSRGKSSAPSTCESNPPTPTPVTTAAKSVRPESPKTSAELPPAQPAAPLESAMDIIVPEVVLHGDAAEVAEIRADRADSGGDEGEPVPQTDPAIPEERVQLSAAPPSSGCTQYDLYCAIHHLGALGGGHYVTTVRQLSGGDAGGEDGSSAGNKWHCYNDNVVTEVGVDDIASPSAYVLFYMRRDVQGVHYRDLLLADEVLGGRGGDAMDSAGVVLRQPPLFAAKEGGSEQPEAGGAADSTDADGEAKSSISDRRVLGRNLPRIGGPSAAKKAGIALPVSNRRLHDGNSDKPAPSGPQPPKGNILQINRGVARKTEGDGDGCRIS